MSYQEFEPPPMMRAVVRQAWTLEIPADGPAWTRHHAIPDGCIEVICRLSGRSRWKGEQPQRFAAGLLTEPAALELGAGSSFVAVRLWPWAWRLIAGRSPAELTDRWLPMGRHLVAMELWSDPNEAMAAFSGLRPTDQMIRIHEALDLARTPRDLARLTGMPARALQRWFARNVGVSPRSYLRLVRFSDAFSHLAVASGGLADHAAMHGFADQAHMAREFRSLAGVPASRARDRASGPFLQQEIDRS